VDPVIAGTVIGHKLKYVEGHYQASADFSYNMIFAMFKYMKAKEIEFDLAEKIMPHLYEHPKMDFDSIIESIKFKKIPKGEISSAIPFLRNKWAETKRNDSDANETNWIMGQLRNVAIGNISFEELKNQITNTKAN